jgi:hypothetical protein
LNENKLAVKGKKDNFEKSEKDENVETRERSFFNSENFLQYSKRHENKA